MTLMAMAPATVVATSTARALRMADAAFRARAAITGQVARADQMPSYEFLTERLSGLLKSQFNGDVKPLTDHTLKRLAVIQDLPNPPEVKAALAVAEIEQLEAAIAGAGLQVGEAHAELMAPTLLGTYELGMYEASRSVGVLPAFSLADADAIEGMKENGLFWIGKEYGRVVPTDEINAIVRSTMLEQGLGRRETGRRLNAAMGKIFGRSDNYWDMFSAVVGTRSRSFGSIGVLEELEVSEYEYWNPIDEATSKVCRALHGTRFKVADGIEQRRKLLNAVDPEEWKEIAPWPKYKDVLNRKGNVLTPAALARRGILMPPLHGHCRSNILAVS